MSNPEAAPAPSAAQDPASDDVWDRLSVEAEDLAGREALLRPGLEAAILAQPNFARALAFQLANQLADERLPIATLRSLCGSAYQADPAILDAARADILAVLERDAACHTLLQPMLNFKGFHALQTYRVSHWLWNEGRDGLAYELQGRASNRFGVDIHPAARIGSGVMMDHATSIVIGETAVVGDDCSFLHEVTLGGTGVKGGDRHPKIGARVLIGAGAKVLGAIHVGDDAKIAAGSVVLKPVPPRCTVAGVPAVPVAGPCKPAPAKRMDQSIEDDA